MELGDEIPPFHEYSRAPIFSKLCDIKEFRLVAEIPALASWTQSSLADRVTNQLLEELRKVLKSAKFYYPDYLAASAGDDYFGVEYADEKYHFAVRCTDRFISLVRTGSGFSNFHDWYCALMPSVQSIFTTVLAEMNLLTKREMDILRGTYRFKFLIYDFVPHGTVASVRNSQIMGQLMRGYPNDAGHMTQDADVAESMARI